MIAIPIFLAVAAGLFSVLAGFRVYSQPVAADQQDVLMFITSALFWIGAGVWWIAI